MSPHTRNGEAFTGITKKSRYGLRPSPAALKRPFPPDPAGGGANFTSDDVTPTTTAHNGIYGAEGETIFFRKRTLAFSCIRSTANFFDLIICNFAAPTSGDDRSSNVVSMRHPFEIFNAIISWIVISVTNICQSFWIWIRNEGIGDQSMNKDFPHYPFFAETDIHPCTLSSSRGVEVLRDDLASPISAVTMPINAANSTEIRDFIKSLVSDNSAPALFIGMVIHVASLLFWRTLDIAHKFDHSKFFLSLEWPAFICDKPLKMEA